MPFNIGLLIARLRGRATCVRASGVKVFNCARILNMSDDDANIRIGAKSVVKGELMRFAHGGRIEIGEWCYIGEGTRIWSGGRITIGNRVLIAHNVNIFDNTTHPISAALRHKQFRDIMESGHPKKLDLGDSYVAIEDDAWICSGAHIRKGIRIGAGAIVAAGSVVTTNVEAWTIVAGNPARVVREIPAHER